MIMAGYDRSAASRTGLRVVRRPGRSDRRAGPRPSEAGCRDRGTPVGRGGAGRAGKGERQQNNARRQPVADNVLAKCFYGR